MKPLPQVLVMVVLVVGGIVVYDGSFARRDGEGAAAPLFEGESAAPDAAPSADEAGVFPLLAGRGDDPWRAGLEQRLADLEARVATPGGRGGEAGRPEPAGGAASSDGPPASEGGEPWLDEGGGERDAEGRRVVTSQELQRFRRMLEAVERQRQAEKAAQGVLDFLAKIDVKLSPDQRQAMVETTLRYQAKWREMSKQPVGDEQGKRERQEAYAGVVQEFEQAVREVVPTAEADVILDAVRRAKGNGNGR